MATIEDDNEAWARHELEHPRLAEDDRIDWQSLWLYRRRLGIQQPRPHFTGDVFIDVPVVGEDVPANVVILQHPCALMDADNLLRPTLLIAKVVDYEEVLPQGWSGNYDVMPLVVHDGNPPRYQAIAFDQLGLVRTSDLRLHKRVACMEIEGVALLLQRWTNVNTRVVVPSWRFVQVIESQFAEAEGLEGWSAQRQRAQVRLVDAMKEATDWLDEKTAETGAPRREFLKNPAYRKNLVRHMLVVAKKLSDDDIAEEARIKAEAQASETEVSTVSEPQPDPENLPAARAESQAPENT